MNKAVKITVGISTNPQVRGRYFASLNDVTGRTNNQLTTRVQDAEGIAEFIAAVRQEAIRQSVTVTVDNQTGGELDI